jgi:rod shape determining protein RodA
MSRKLSLQVAIPVLLISSFGVFTVWSVNRELISGHLFSLIIGFALFFVFSFVSVEIFKKLTSVFYVLLVLGLAILFSQPAIRGAQRWLVLGNYTLQLAEFGKPFYILSLAGICNIFIPRKLRQIALFIVIGLLPILLVIKQPDLGNALLYIVVFVTAIFSGYTKYKHMLIIFLISLIFLPLGLSTLKPYQKERLVSFTTPGYDPQGIGYNSTQALISVGSGKIVGRGLGRGPQSHLRFLPESHTDFIFASLVEELGFVSGLVLLLSYGALFWAILAVAINSNDIFSRLVSLGVFSLLFIQTFINVGMNLGLVPITGVTLPLVSYGGSSIVSTFISLGLIQSIINSRKGREIVIR